MLNEPLYEALEAELAYRRERIQRAARPARGKRAARAARRSRSGRDAAGDPTPARPGSDPAAAA